jgi:hypothetical protein
MRSPTVTIVCRKVTVPYVYCGFHLSGPRRA